ncbi:MAG: class I SAM-dependent RNA methyltransferase [Nitrospirae bacterium]|nr:class I SAM-dependent RNA methyltransferase [Nitrospirota bacterium]
MFGSQKSRILITCPKGLSPYVREELSTLEFPVLSEGIAAVLTEGTLSDTMLLNLYLRTGHRVLFLLRDFHAAHADELYENVYDIGWEDFLTADGYICVTSHVENPTIRDSRFANLKCKDAIVDRLMIRYGSRPDSGSERNRSVVHLFWKDDQCSIYLDTSGEPLSKRGYRKIPFKAPMQETLAAAVILATGFSGSSNLVNPMCGSGTLAIEAALIGLNKASGLLRDNFGFMHIRGFERGYWDELTERAKSLVRETLQGRIIATDRDPEAVDSAKKNAAAAGVGHLIEFGTCDFGETPVPDGGGVVLFNPEYGERMGRKKDLEETYRGVGDFMKKSCRGYKGFIFTGNPDLAKNVGLRTRRRIQFFNSEIECRLLEYELYEGSRKRQGNNEIKGEDRDVSQI